MKKLLSTLLFLFVVAIISLSAQNRVYAPVLVEPGDGDDGQMPDVTLNWAAVAGTGGIVEYELQVDLDAAFPDPVIFPWSEFTGKQMEGLLFATQYYWRVRAKTGMIFLTGQKPSRLPFLISLVWINRVTMTMSRIRMSLSRQNPVLAPL